MIEVRNLSLELGEFKLKKVNLSIKGGEYFVLLGPTGAGKTILVECLVGIYRPREGSIWLNGIEVTHYPPELRNIGYLPQDYTLFPHLTVEKNIAFALEVKKTPQKIVKGRVKELAELLGIEHLLARYPLNLSGGEKQRVSLARALATSPQVLIFDEPLSALDESLRASLCKELRQIHQQTKATFLHVCHNFEETVEVAQRVAIMREGEIVQVGEVAEIFRHPNCEFVANFVRAENIFAGEGQIADNLTKVSLGPIEVFASGMKEGKVFLTVRPEEILLSKEPPNSFQRNIFEGKTATISDKGSFIRLEVDVGVVFVVFLTRRLFSELNISRGDQVYLWFDPESVHLFN